MRNLGLSGDPTAELPTDLERGSEGKINREIRKEAKELRVYRNEF
jgi:hypothetical protein